MQGIRYLTDGKLSEVISKTLDVVDGKVEYDLVRRLLVSFTDKDDSDAYKDIEMTLRERFEIFEKNNVKFFLEGNPQKASPSDLEQKVSIFFSISEHRLDEYKGLLRLVSLQILHHCMQRPEGSHLITLFCDECPRWGKGIDFSSFLALSRSRQVAAILAGQSFLQWEKVWGKEEAKIILELCRICLILSNSDPQSGDIFCKWAGSYKEIKKSVTEGGKKSGSSSVTYEDKPILEPADLMALQESGDGILYIKGKMFRVNAFKARYYKDRKLNKISKKCLALNEKNKKARKEQKS